MKKKYIPIILFSAVAAYGLFFVPKTRAAIVFDASSTFAFSGQVVVTSTLTVGSGANRLLVVSISAPVAPSAPGVTVNGVVASSAVTLTANGRYDSIWYIVNPPTGVNNVSTSFAVARSGNLFISSYAGVAQINALDKVATSTSAGDITASSTITTASSSELIVDNTSRVTTDVVSAFNPGQVVLIKKQGVTSVMDASYLLATTSQAYATGYTYATSVAWTENQAAFKSAATGGTGFTWTGGGADGNWTTGDNWSGGVAPSSTSTAIFDTTSGNNATVNTSIHVASIQMNAGYTGMITQSAGANILIDTSFIQSSGTFAGNASSSFSTATFQALGGTFTGNGETLTVSSPASGTFACAGNFTSSTNTHVVLAGGLSLQGNAAPCTLNADISFNTSTSPGFNIYNGSVLNASGTTWASGSVNNQSGTINFNGSTWISGSLTVGSSSVLNMASTTNFTVNGDLSIIGTSTYPGSSIRIDGAYNAASGMNLSGKDLVLGDTPGYSNTIGCTGDFNALTSVRSVAFSRPSLTPHAGDQFSLGIGCTLTLQSFSANWTGNQSIVLSSSSRLIVQGDFNVVGPNEASSGAPFVNAQISSSLVMATGTQWISGEIDNNGGDMDLSRAATATVYGAYSSLSPAAIFRAPAMMSLVRDPSRVSSPNLSLTPSSTFHAGSGTLMIAGNFSGGAGFDAGTGSVIFTGTSQAISLSNTFHNLTKVVTSTDTITLDNGSTQTINGFLDLEGASGNLLSLVSNVTSTQWKIKADEKLCYLSVQGSNNIGTSPLGGFQLTDAGNNSRWNFISSASCASGGGGSAGGGSPPPSVGVAGGPLMFAAAITTPSSTPTSVTPLATTPSRAALPSAPNSGASTPANSANCISYLTDYVFPYKINSPTVVKKLQIFLNALYGAKIRVNGVYDKPTQALVDRLQLQYHDKILKPWIPYGLPNEHTPTTNVYKTTQYWINALFCPGTPLPSPRLP